MKFRKKPVVIEAERVSVLHEAAERHWSSLPKWLTDAYDKGDVIFANYPKRIVIKTLEGSMTGDLGDWIICGVKQELYPCKADIFEVTYDAVEIQLC